MADIWKRITSSAPNVVPRKLDASIERVRTYVKHHEQAMQSQSAHNFIADNSWKCLDISAFKKQLLTERSQFSCFGAVWTKAEDRSVQPSCIPLHCIQAATMMSRSTEPTQLKEQLQWAAQFHAKTPTDFICKMEVDPVADDVIKSALLALAV